MSKLESLLISQRLALGLALVLVLWAALLPMLSWLLGYGGFELGMLSLPMLIAAAIAWGRRGGLIAGAWASAVMILAGLRLADTPLQPVHLIISTMVFVTLGLGIGVHSEHLGRQRTRLTRLLEDYENVFDGTHDAMFLVELDASGSFHYQQTNRAHAELTGIANELIRGKAPEELLGEEQGGAVAANYVRCLKERGPITYEETIALPGGTRVWQTTLTPVMSAERIWICGASRDITELKQAQVKLLERESQLEAILQSTADGLLATSREGEVLAANHRFYELWGMPDAADGARHNQTLLRHALERLTNPDAFEDRLNQLWATSDEADDIIHLNCGRVLERHSRPLVIAGELRGRVWSFRDVTERSRHEQQLVQLSLHDQLTGVYNRTYFAQELTRLGASDSSFPVSLISIDLDGLKLVNDTLGHERGDELIAACARVLRGSLRSTDILARIGGDEFTVVLPHTSHDDVLALLERIKRNVTKHNTENPALPVVISIGSATAHTSATPLEGALRVADAQMYRDKLERSQSVRDQILGSLLSPLDHPDRLVEGRPERLSDLCLELGLKLRLADQNLTDLLLLAKVHDLGMAGVPEEVLCGERPLSAPEWDLVSLHPETGYRIALASRDLAGVAELILRHHERWDGAGYPAGLRGQEIPMICRIFAVADAFVAMTHDRPFRLAMEPTAALREIQSCSGSQFDPAVVEVFAELFAAGAETVHRQAQCDGTAKRADHQDPPDEPGSRRVISLHDRRLAASQSKKD